MQTLSCPRCGQPRSAHTPCPYCGASGLSTDVPPIPDVAAPASPPIPDVAAPAVPVPAALPPSVPIVARTGRSDLLGRVGYLVAAVLATGALMLFYGAVWGGNNDDAGPETEEAVAPPELADLPTPPAPPGVPAPPDVPRPPGMSDSDWEQLQRDLREAQRDVEQAAREAQRDVEQAAREAQRDAEQAAREAEQAARDR